MDGFREGDERRRPTPPDPHAGHEETSVRLEEIGDLHFHAAAYSSAVEYYESALRVARAEHDGTRDSVAIHTKLSDCHRLQGQFDEALRSLDQARGSLEPDDAIAFAAVDVRQARILQARGQFDDAITVALDAFGFLSLTDRHEDVGAAQMVLGIANACTGRLTKAREFFEDALATYRRIDDEVSQAHVFNNLALIAKRGCQWGRALDLYERAERLFQAHGAAYECDVLLLNKAVLFRKMGRGAEARVTAERGVRRARSRGDQADLCRLLLLTGQLAIEEEHFDAAERALLESKVLAERQDMQRELALADEFIGDLMRATGRADEAVTNYELAIERATRISDQNDILAEVRRRQAELALEQGRAEDALVLAEEGLALVEEAGEEFERGFLHRVRAGAYGLLDQPETSLEAALAAVEAFRAHQLVPQAAEALVELAEIHLAAETTEGALLARGRIQEALRLNGAEGVVDTVVLFSGLARAELALHHFDEAMIALFELERLHGSEDARALDAIESLRREIDRAMTDDAVATALPLHELVDLPEQVGDIAAVADGERGEAVGTVEEILARTGEVLRADRGAIALRTGRGRLDVVATFGMPRATARELCGRALALTVNDEVRVWSDVYADADWDGFADAARHPLGAAAAFALRDQENLRGVVFFDRATDDVVAFEAASLAVADTRVRLLRDALLRPATAHTAPSASEPASWVVTGSPRMAEVLSLCATVAPSPYTVMFNGETGTGKGLLAKVIHESSPRAGRPFVMVNCAAVPEALLESELFGHVRGSFTGADHDKEGLVRSANGGTLFLDEVGKMPLSMQAKLLHFLDDHRIRPVGGKESLPVDVRVICASKRDLKKMVEQESFLEDLYYRLMDFPIEVPPLRDRGDDVVLLTEYFLERAAAELHRPVPRLTRGAASRLRGHTWPGNVRELEKVVRRSLLMAGDEGRVRESHLPTEIQDGPTSGDADLTEPSLRPLKEQIAELERRAVAGALESTAWNRSKAARRLNVSYPTLLQKIRIYGLNPDS